MNDKLAEEWIEIAKILGVNPYNRIVCPQCRRCELEVFDKKVDETHFDRIVQCQECGFSEAIFIGGNPVKFQN